MTRRVTVLGAAAFAASLAGGAAPDEAGQAPKGNARAGQADRIFVNGRVWTGDPGRPLAEGLAVRGTTILAVGTSGDVRRHSANGTEVVDLRGRFVAPGFIDGHLHLLGGSQSLEELRLDDAETFGALTQRVKDWAAAHPDAHWVTGEGWTYAAFPDGLPSRAQLDAVVPSRPAWLVSYDGHTGWANSMALRLANVTRETKDPPGGAVVRDDEGRAHRSPEGERHGPRREARPEAPAPREGARAPAGDHPGRGVGPHHACTRPASTRRSWRSSPAPSRPSRACASTRPSRWSGTRPPKPSPGRRSCAGVSPPDRLRVGAVKGYVDGVVEAKTAAMFEPYPGGGTGLPTWTQEELDRTVAAYDKAGWPVMLHAIGDRGIDMALTAFERAARVNGTTGRRHRVEHVEVPRRADLPRFKAGGIVASTQAMFPYPNRNHLDVYVPTLGPERARRALAFKAIDDAGAVQAFGSDWPVFTAEVVRGIACAVTRTTVEGTPPGGWEPEQRLTVEAALRHFTRDAAFAEHAEKEKGTLEPGKLADFVVLSQDLLAVPPERIKDAKVLLTVLGGQDTFRAKEF